jgi:hypothetical protein
MNKLRNVYSEEIQKEVSFITLIVRVLMIMLKLIAVNDSDLENPVLDYIWEDMTNYGEQKENCVGGFRPQNGAKNVNDIVVTFELFFS